MCHQGHPGLTSRQVTACRLPAMGTQVELLVVGAPSETLMVARRRLAELEARWSRFRPDSELSTLNRAAGRPVAVSPETLTLLALAVLGWQTTAGRFDPTVLDALEAVGYDRSFDQLLGDGPTDGARPAPGPAPGLAGLRINPEAGTVTLPARTRLDLGGIAKGYTADLLCAQLRTSGATGACVNIGGDLRVSGTAPRGGPWTIAVPHPHGGQAATLQLTEGAAATSSPLQRAWQAGGRPAHHLIHPHTSRPAQTDITQVTVVAAEAWRAEVATKATFLAGLPDALTLATRLGTEALVIDQDGGLHLTARLQQATTPLAGTP